MGYIRQGQQLVNELNMYADMLRNGKKIPYQIFGPIQADLNALAQIVQGGQALAYSLAISTSSSESRFPATADADSLLRQLQELGADLARHNARHAARRRAAGSATPKRTGAASTRFVPWQPPLTDTCRHCK